MNQETLAIVFQIAGFVTAVVLGVIIIPNILFISHKKRLYDQPDARKIHKTPIPRLGGLSFLPVIMITMFLNLGMRWWFGVTLKEIFYNGQMLQEFLFLFSGLWMLYLVGEADDLVGVGYRYKFIVQFIAASLMVSSGNYLHSLYGILGIYEIPAWIGMPITVVILVFITNAINLIDGIDGLASGLCCLSIAVLGGQLMQTKHDIYGTLAFVTLGTLIPFWVYNVFGNERRGKKLFMGDAGSLTLGYILSFLVIHLSIETDSIVGPRSMVIAFSTLLVPMLDVVRVSLHRIRKGRNPFLPDRNHIHHKLIRTGMRTRSVLVTIIMIAVFFVVFNAILVDYVNITIILILDVVIWTVIQLLINKGIVKYGKAHPELSNILTSCPTEEDTNKE